ncbi:MAG: XRE family transcriptional regulator [Mycobacterium sp.]|nr:XRE family transcriptional regulator [Mycobacterium sp.]
MPQRFHDTIPATAARDYGALTACYRNLYWVVPATLLQHAIFRHAELGSALLESTPQETSKNLAPWVAEAWLLAGRLLLFDLQDPDAARPCLVEALEAAHKADDAALGAAALGHLATEASRHTSGSPRAHELMRGARAFAARALNPAVLVAWLDTVEAEIELRFGNHTQAATLIAHAEKAYRDRANGAEPEWLDWFTAHRLTTAKANTLLSAGRQNDARLALERALNDLPASEAKLRALTYCDLGALAAHARRPEAACALLTSALDELGDKSYASVNTRIATVRNMLNEWNDIADVRALDAQLTTWNATMTAASA